MAQKARIDITANDKATAQLKRVQKSMQAMKQQALALGSALGLGFGVAGMVAFTRKSVAMGSAITDMAIATRTGIEEIQVLNTAALKAGASADQMANLLIRVQKSAADSARGLSTARMAFALLGIDTRTFINLKPEQMLERLGKALVAAGGDTRAYGAALDILGTRNAPKLMEVMQRLGKEGFTNLTKQAKEMGQVMRADTAQGLDDAADAMERLNTAATVFTGTLIVDMKKDLEQLNPIWKQLREARNFLREQVGYFPVLKAAGNLLPDKSTGEGFEFNTASSGNLLGGQKDAPAASAAISDLGTALNETWREQVRMDKALKDFMNNMGGVTAGTAQLGMANISLADDIRKLKLGFEGVSVVSTEALQNLRTWQDDAAQGVTAMAGALEDGLVNAAMRGKLAFGDMAQFVLAEMQRIFIRSMILRPLFGGIGGMLTGAGFGTLGEAFTNSFGGAEADGGPVAAGKTYLVGERGPELLTMGGSGHITPNRQLGGGGPQVVIESVDMRGASVETVARLERMLWDLNRNQGAVAQAAVQDAFTRNPAFGRI